MTSRPSVLAWALDSKNPDPYYYLTMLSISKKCLLMLGENKLAQYSFVVSQGFIFSFLFKSMFYEQDLVIAFLVLLFHVVLSAPIIL